MNFALIVDSCKVGSYQVRNGKAYKFTEPESSSIPFQFHHSIGNECFMGFWSYPFVFDGCFLNWQEWKELPDLDLDVIFVSIEKRFNECTIEYLRSKYPNAKIYGYVKETWNWEHTWQNRLNVFNQCDEVIVPVEDINLFPQLINNCTRKISYLPQPVNIDYLYDNFYKEDRAESIFAYDISWNKSRQGNTMKFAQYISRKYNIELVNVNTQHEASQWESFLNWWPKSTFHINLDPMPIFPGQQAIQCATLGVIQIGGMNESHPKLFPDTATNDYEILENKFSEYLENYDSRIAVMQDAFKRVNDVYSYQAIRDKFKITDTV